MNTIIRDANGSIVQQVTAKPAQPKRKTGREMAGDVCRLRAFLAETLRNECEPRGLNEEHWGPAAVTSAFIVLERQGVRGIGADVELNL